MKRLIILLLCLNCVISVMAQAERADIRKGNKLFQKEKYSEAEVEYLRALGKAPTSYEANYNLGGAAFKQGRFPDAQEAFGKSVKDSTNIENLPKALYNLGTSYLAERKLDESIEAFKGALKLNPNDTLAKYNLAYAKLLKQKDDQNNQDNQDQNKDQNQDQNKDNQDQNQDSQDQDQNKDQNKDNNDPNQDNQDQDQPEPRDGEMSEQEAEQLLQAMQASEDKTQEKLNEEKKGVVIKKGGKNW